VHNKETQVPKVSTAFKKVVTEMATIIFRLISISLNPMGEIARQFTEEKLVTFTHLQSLLFLQVTDQLSKLMVSVSDIYKAPQTRNKTVNPYPKKYNASYTSKKAFLLINFTCIEKFI
jgi:hypothetical protein